MIRRFQARDRALYLALCDEFYHSSAVLHPIDPAHYARAFDEMMRSDAYLVGYVIECDGAAAGYALLVRGYSQEAGGPVVWVDELYLRPAFRSRGLGTEFFRFLKKEHPAARYRLEIEPDNDRARALYQRVGFEDLGYLQMICDQTDFSGASIQTP